jgi:medium-chain acyl-[acyl-carrier-protein] hydrolase
MQPSDDKWIVRSPPESGELALICLSPAGGSPEQFRAWKQELDPAIDVLALRLPGHVQRLSEPPYQDWQSLIADAFQALLPFLARPHAFYGHSFGGRLAYELTHRASAVFPGMTRRLFVGGCRAPDYPQPLPYLHLLPDQEFGAALKAMGGTPDEVVANADLIRLLLPAIRAEIRLAEVWENRHPQGVDVPITAVCGKADPIDGPDRMRRWTGFSSHGEFIELAAGHFFLETHRAELIEVINSRLDGAPSE